MTGVVRRVESAQPSCYERLQHLMDFQRATVMPAGGSELAERFLEVFFPERKPFAVTARENP
jgi:hypothetical protein